MNIFIIFSSVAQALNLCSLHYSGLHNTTEAWVASGGTNHAPVGVSKYKGIILALSLLYIYLYSCEQSLTLKNVRSCF